MNIKRYINQRKFRSFNVNLSCNNKCSANLYSHGKMKLNCVNICLNESKLLRKMCINHLLC